VTNNEADTKIEIEWSYTPQNYFEESISPECEGCSIEIEDGHITARMSADLFDSRPGFRDSVTENLNHYFLGALPIRRQAFELHGGTINRIWRDGRRDITLEVHSAESICSSESVNLIVIDDAGIVHDTRRDRINATKNLSDLSVRHAATDRTVRKILQSFLGSVRNPEDELAYLFEVWEALQTEFGGGKQGRNDALKALGIPDQDFKRLFRLANNEPLNQGRHRGAHADSLRDATKEELDEAWAITRNMIASYMNHLDGQSTHT
jgi:hypothetical protein